MAVYLLSLAERKATGFVEVGERRVVLNDGEVVNVWPAPDDESLGEFLLKSGRISSSELSKAFSDSETLHTSLDICLKNRGSVAEEALLEAHNALWIDRLVRGFRAMWHDKADLPTLEHGGRALKSAKSVPLPILVLDALARCAMDEDAAVVGSHLNSYVVWLDSPHAELAKSWSTIDQTTEPQLVSTILVRMPPAAATIAALARAGIVELTRQKPPSIMPEPKKVTLPRPPPRLSTLPSPQGLSDAVVLRNRPLPSHIRYKLEHEQQTSAAPNPVITPTELQPIQLQASPLHDPVGFAEQKAKALSKRDAPAYEIAQAWCEFAQLMRNRIGSIEDAARAYEQAAAADPACQEALRQSSLLFRALGDERRATTYARAAADSAAIGAERANALKVAASIARSRGNIDGCIEALCEAAAEDDTRPELHELIAHLLAEQGNLDGAVAHARLAAGIWQAEFPERSRAIFAWACELKPAETNLALEYQQYLNATGHSEAAIAVLADAARRTHDADKKRELLLAGAQLAEEIERFDLAVELLIEAYDNEPHVDLYYEPLYEDLRSANATALRAILAEEFSDVGPEDQRAHWLERAGEATSQLLGSGPRALLLFSRALDVDPKAQNALTRLREHATTGRDRALLANALQHAADAYVQTDPQKAKKLLEELALLAEVHLGAINRALNAWKRIHRLFPDDDNALDNISRLSSKARIHDGLLAAAERELASAPQSERYKFVRKVAAMLRDRPKDQRRVADLYHEYVAARPEDESAASALIWLLDIMEELEELAAFLQSYIDLVTNKSEKIRLLAKLAATQTRLANHRSAAHTCFTLLTLSPQHSEAIARLNRAAVRLNDPVIVRRAAAMRVRVANTSRQRGRALAYLARVFEASGDINAAVASADAALIADPTAADAALILFRHAYRLPPERITVILEMVRSILGDSQPLLVTLARAALATNNRTLYARTLEAWHQLMPLDAEPIRQLLAWEIQGDNAHAIVRAAENALAGEVINPSTSAALHAAISRIDALGMPALAAQLALKTIDRLGDQTLPRLTLELATRSREAKLLASALERTLTSQQGEARIHSLRQLSQLHRKGEDKLSELRALLRLINLVPGDRETLSRLKSLYIELGDAEQFLAVTALEVEAAVSIEEKLQKLLELAAATAQLTGDKTRVEKYIRVLILDHLPEPDWISTALGVLFTLDDDLWAVDRSLKIALDAPPQLGGPMCEWIAATARERLNNPALALQIAVAGLEVFPHHEGLLKIMEELALASGNDGVAREVYDRLIRSSVGPHGRRAMAFRSGRWFELAGLAEEAFKRYLFSFDISPSIGAAFSAARRLAYDLNLLEALLQLDLSLAAAAPDLLIKKEHLCRAGRFCLDKLGNPKKAFDLLLEAWMIKGDEAVRTQLYRTVRLIKSKDPAAAKKAWASLNEHGAVNAAEIVDISDADRPSDQKRIELFGDSGGDNSKVESASVRQAKATTLESFVEDFTDELTSKLAFVENECFPLPREDSFADIVEDEPNVSDQPPKNEDDNTS
ncbi:MAG: hypothetical protein JXA30_01330 [Deltaproteobacteria bacterium]|nr:hypothetical protein [Deltaproteobacteria bacterium]